MQIDLHPCGLGDLPGAIELIQALPHLSLTERTIRNHWKTHYPWVIREKSGLFVDIRACDSWMDSRGMPMISPKLIVVKKRRNPGWVPVSEQIDSGMLIEGLRGVSHA